MRHQASLFIIAIVAASVRADDPETLTTQASDAYQAKEYAKAAQLYEAAVNAGANDPQPAYNAACCYARLGKPDDAFTWLGHALDAGWRNVKHLKSDADLEPLHADKRWQQTVDRCEEQLAEFNKTLKEPDLREELLKRMQEDQRIRMMPDPNVGEMMKIDADNTKFMKTVIDKYGWPGKSMVGADGALAAFLLVQHADEHPDFQRRCLELLVKAVGQNEATASHMAYLTDRVFVREGRPQRYGTQFLDTRFLGEKGELKLQPIEDEANVDARRKAVGLPPLAEYVRQMQSSERP